MFIHSNLAELRQQDPVLFADNSIFSREARKISMFDFINNIMSKVYHMIFNARFPRVPEEMKTKLQLFLDIKTGDWFLYKYHTVIRVYGFIEAPYLLPASLTPR